MHEGFCDRTWLPSGKRTILEDESTIPSQLNHTPIVLLHGCQKTHSHNYMKRTTTIFCIYLNLVT